MFPCGGEAARVSYSYQFGHIIRRIKPTNELHLLIIPTTGIVCGKVDQMIHFWSQKI